MFSSLQIGIVSSSVLALAVGYLLWIVVTAWLSWRRKMQLIKNVPCGDAHWLLGSLYYFPGPNEEGLAFVRDRTADFPRMGTVWYGPVNYTVTLNHPETIKTVMKSSEPKPSRIGPYRFLLPWLGDGLLISRDKKWARNRRLLTPAFHFDILKPYITIKNEAMDILLNKLTDFDDKGVSVDVHEQMSLVTLDILLRCAFTYDNDVQLRGSNHPFVIAVLELTDALTTRLLSPWFYNDFIYYNLTSPGRRFRRNCDYVHSVSSDIIRHRRDALEENPHEQSNRRYLDFLDVLLTAKDSDGQGLSDQEIRDEADTFLFEGHDTTASGISWTLYALAKHPEHMKRCQEEVDKVLADRDSEYILWEDLPKLTYLTMCIKEALRMYAPVPFIQRELVNDLTIGGCLIPKGTVIDMFIYALHHNPTVWENSMEYRPDRFTAENIAKMDPYAFAPFSAGPRNCIGQNFAMHELKIVIARIVRRFNLELDPLRPAKQFISVVMKTENGLYLRAKHRSD